MKFKYIINPKSLEFIDAINILMEYFPRDWDYIPKIKKLIIGKFPQNTEFYLLTLKNNKRILGICLYRYWTDIKSAILEYLVVKKSKRSQGIGTKLYQKMETHLLNKNCKYLLFSAGRDEKFDKIIDRKEIEIRQKRLKFYEKLRARPLTNFQYENPLPLSRKEDDYMNPYLLLSTKFLNKEGINGKDLYLILKRNYKTYYFGVTENNNKIVKNVLNSINKNQFYQLRKLKYINEKS